MITLGTDTDIYLVWAKMLRVWSTELLTTTDKTRNMKYRDETNDNSNGESSLTLAGRAQSTQSRTRTTREKTTETEFRVPSPGTARARAKLRWYADTRHRRRHSIGRFTTTTS